MELSKARRTGLSTCKRCGGSGEYGVGCGQTNGKMDSGVCYRCGGTGKQAAGFEGNRVSAYVQRSTDRRDGTGTRRGTIDVIATISTYATPKATRGYGCRPAKEIQTAVRIVGRTVDGRTFDKTVRAAGTDNASLLAFEEQVAAIWRRVHGGLGASPKTLEGDDEAAVLRDLGVI